jgi:release factor glutamine methyltransferase
MTTLQQALNTFYKQYVILPKQEIQTLVAFVLKKKREELFLSLEQNILHSSIDHIREFLEKRRARCPLEYLIGHVDFFHCKIAVNPHVLVPRVETEVLLDRILRRVQGKQIEVVFDLCTGSGCLGIGFKKHRPECQVYLSDISSEALSVAQMNAVNNQIEVTCLLGDLLEPFEEIPLADLVMCNPPYISDHEFYALEPSVKNFEPRLALTSGPSGLEIFERLAHRLPCFMNKGALLALEIGSTQKNAVNKIFSYGSWRNIQCEQDYSGLDRFIFLELE